MQVDEPALVLDLNPNERAAFEFARLETKLGVYAGSDELIRKRILPARTSANKR
ncbi:hypothetical protein IE4872_PC00113 (plasmid) [Rhizobium gallicum]|uniref:Uncharacterized protein n=1 Tax=Rhizobium gallicum TaxID=56730 RepID=A0A1L5NQI8_9HYPH|nr:hypothetical protein IE4872_PC00113 [Rhizobium gallicum]